MNPTLPFASVHIGSSIPITVLAHEPAQAGAAGHIYHVAGQRVVTDLRTPWLGTLLLDRKPLTLAGLPRAAALDAMHAYTTVFEGVDTIGCRPVEVLCRTDGTAYRVSLGGIGEFAVAAGGDAVICLHSEPDTHPDDLALAALGAPFLIACALRNTWAVHAGAVASRYGVAAFAGESGLGKSTLAKFLATREDCAFELVSDDVLPVTLDAGRPFAHGDYPQFKLPTEQQPPTAEKQPSLPLRALFVLAQPASNEGDVAVARLRAGESALALARHTVASRLFGRSLLAQHLRFCAEAAGALPVYELTYPRRLDALPAVRQAIENVLSLA